MLRLEGIFAPTRLDGQRGELAQRLWRSYVLAHADGGKGGGKDEHQSTSVPSRMAVDLRIRVVPLDCGIMPAPLPLGMQRFHAEEFANEG